MAMEFFKNYIFKDSERISDCKLKSKLVPNQIIEPLLCVFINFSLKNSYRIKIRIASMTSGYCLYYKETYFELTPLHWETLLCLGTRKHALTKGYNALIH